MEDKTSSSTTPSTKSTTTTSSVVVERLITKDDPFHIHKTLGILCLCSFSIRLCCMIFGSTDMGFYDYPQYTIATIVLHFLLSVSSFVFKIPFMRIKSNGGYRIWPEYRLHSIVFACRSLSCIYLIWHEQQHDQDQEPNYDWNIMILLLSMAAADISSHMQGKYKSNSIRDLNGIDPSVKFFFSAMQILGSNFVLSGVRRYSTHFAMIIIIQGNAFLMTLQRKNLASQITLLIIYGLALTFGGIITIFDVMKFDNNYDNDDNNSAEISWNGNHYIMNLLLHYGISNTAILLRLGPRMPLLQVIQNNKYILWSSLGLILRQHRYSFFLNEKYMYILAPYVLFTTASILVLGYTKRNTNGKATNNTKSKETERKNE